ncbi:ribonuclease H-like domain-containing protein [Xylaria digitata]|nr:ribonuclease H-like domain-containing protein [Xylaria digitata]
MGQVQISGSKSPTDIWFPRRPAFGTQGNPVTLWANYFKLDASAKVPLLKYSLKCTLKIPKEGEGKRKEGAKSKGNDKKNQDRKPRSRKLHGIIKSALARVAGSTTFATEFKDQVISLEPFSLPENQIVTVPYHEEGKEDEYEVKFDGPTTVDLPGLLEYLKTMREPSGDIAFPRFEEAINALSIITGYYARSNTNTSALGRSRYFPLEIKGEQYDLGSPDYNRIIRGYFQSARPATGRLILNANVSHGVFRPTGLVSDLIELFKHNYPLLHKALAKLRGRCTVLSEDKNPKKTRVILKIIRGLANRSDGTGANRPRLPQLGASAKDVQFYLQAPAPAGLQGNAFCSVADYYKKRYGYDVNPKYPVVNVGSEAKPVYMPAELVEIIDGQPLRRKTTPDETRGMINFSCRSPYANATSISTYGRQVLGLDNPEFLGRFGIQVGKTLLTVRGRELLPPTIVYKDGKQPMQDKIININEGEWNMESVRVFKPGTKIDRWFWISIDRGYRAHQRHFDVAKSINQWVSFLKTQGIAIADQPLANENEKVTVVRSPADAIRPVFKQMQAKNPQFVFVVLPGRKTDTEIYNDVKKLGDREFGYLTQNVLSQNLLKNNPQVFANLGLKINLKMGGINHKLRNDITIVKRTPTMVVGYDVTHPTNLAGNAQGLPSIVGLVSSIDDHLGQWPSTAWAQDGRKEMLGEELESRFAERLQLYRKYNQRLPENIIIYRDGVSEGQFIKVLQEELPWIRKACEKIYPATQRPKLLIIVSVKRHQTRFYPTDPKNTIRSSRNIKNGTIVDRGVTQAATWDFFLTAHKGLQGTSRPAHYTVLLDEVFGNMSREEAVNQLEKLTYEICHLFGRATKAVSICPPAYYADILCTRSRVHLSDLFENSDMQSTTSSTTISAVPSVAVHENLKNSMYYI